MDQEIKEFFNQKGISDFSHENLTNEFSDNLLFKKLLEILILRKLSHYLKVPLKRSSTVEFVFPRVNRKAIVSAIELDTELSFPKTYLSNARGILLTLSFIIPAIILVVLFFLRVEFFLIYVDKVGFPIFLFVCTLPAIIISIFSPKFFHPLDWPNVITMDDLLDLLVTRNWKAYYENNFEKTLRELEISSLTA